jgi:SAM-dependent methyltransferase
MNLLEIAPGLEPHPSGYWTAQDDAAAVSYPEEASDFCHSLEARSFWFAHRNAAILSAVRHYPPSDGPVLDVGAGNGFVSMALQDAGFPTVAIEPSAAGVRNAAARGVTHVVRGTLPSPAFAPGIAGAVGLFDVIEHLPDDRVYLASLPPYLKARGRLYVTVPAYQWLWSDDDDTAGHYRRYTARSLRLVLESAGFDVDYIGYLFWWLPPLTFVTRTVASKLRRLTGKPFVASAGEHTAGSELVRAMLAWSFAMEIPLIAKGIRVPIGTSCLAVATLRSRGSSQG